MTFIWLIIWLIYSMPVSAAWLIALVVCIAIDIAEWAGPLIERLVKDRT